jgi:hypothetical protein
MMQIRIASILFAFLVGGCSISEYLPKWMSDDVAGPEPAYRYIIASSVGGIVGKPADAYVLQISNLRRVDSHRGASWLACVKDTSYALPRYYAVFIQRDRIVDSRLSVLIDQCEIQGYTAFDWEGDSKPPR